MVVNVTKVSDGVSEVELPSGCVICGGDLHVRMNAANARSYCPQCRHIGSARTIVKGDGLRVDFRVQGKA